MPAQRTPNPVLRIGPTETTLLAGLGTYLYLDAKRLTRRSYSPNSLRFVQKKLAALVKAGMVESFTGYSNRGEPPLIYTPSMRGWCYLADELGMPMPHRWRPSEAIERGYEAYKHDLQTADFGIAVEVFCKQAAPQASLREFVHDRFLPYATVTLADGTSQRMKPDAFVDLRLLKGHQAKPMRRSLVLELDRSSEYQKDWRKKVAGLLAYAAGPYQQQFDTTSLTICVVCPGNPTRVRQLITWTEAELTAQGKQDHAQLFAFTGVDPEVSDPTALVLSPCWRVPYQSEPVPLLSLPPIPGLERPISRLEPGAMHDIADLSRPEPDGVPLARTYYLPQADYLRFLTAIGEEVPTIAKECLVDEAA